MNRGLSLYFDLLRALAAFEVFIFHMNRFRSIGLPFAWWNSYGHEAVVLFFVLSGFVITFAAGERDRTLERYIVSRLSRILSVAVPAVLLTYVADRIGHAVNPALYAPFPLTQPIVRLVAGLTLLNESWVSIQIFSNTPIWSIGYEFWYYFLFASTFFLRGRLRIVSFVAVAVIAGPRALLMFPIWLIGSWAYRERWSARLPRPAIVALAVGPLIGVWAYVAQGWHARGDAILIGVVGSRAWHDGLHWSQDILSDGALGLLIGAHFIGMRGLGPAIERVLGPVSRSVRFVAAYSFTLYALHQPMILLFTATLGSAALPVTPFSVGGLVLGVVLLVGTLTERQRDRLRPIFSRLLTSLVPARVLAASHSRGIP